MFDQLLQVGPILVHTLAVANPVITDHLRLKHPISSLRSIRRLTGRSRLSLPLVRFRYLEAALIRLVVSHLALVLVERNISLRTKHRIVFPALEFALKGRYTRAVGLP